MMMKRMASRQSRQIWKVRSLSKLSKDRLRTTECSDGLDVLGLLIAAAIKSTSKGKDGNDESTTPPDEAFIVSGKLA